jgi:hypothetical protein
MIQRIEQWLRRIFADEMYKVDRDLKDVFTSELQRIETSFAQERGSYLAEIRGTLTTDLKQFRADLVAEKSLIAAPQHWTADADDVKAEHDLRHPRPARRR